MTLTVEVVAALIRDADGRVLLVRKRGTEAFMQPGGKRDAGEDDITALARELDEELGCTLVAGSAHSLGDFEAVSANEPGWRVRAAVYAAAVSGAIAPRAEIADMIWVDPASPPDICIAPLTRDHVLPLAARQAAGHG
ncbi:NUDIX domain-containing protein [Bradyrhizobium sp. U87765 SZCCT0131]|uniref:NUDIX hydrolase n=1 Tax=unclassified Bradyrhizobium TaxID=2631580 RepID=UPI001BA5DC69|nr:MULTISPECIES: NUDIX domain-containing protein [unclassified Bradyrhizobium]MBR1220828.1 NUDIX domain-containing protein [Bradyrhizobium sp. U87765 SZCCT0131]MBR1260352.1 NUDIX domain-containing protein [Bradyrhizobium sp. U87765 SZCCT0134]MBR1307399.1 NUDIX domain-containing protein [Bradyrhizobium sp. U87765 SZCCT0110]MBR1321353.1 NUDIX domain-containing protein [Bradyrhizobium sp. U87765 SZCCT0109]MBR1349666.1 NUDIX domain-containing protein [Bradyrhizobium sp. U87765 SZCCT0048]